MRNNAIIAFAVLTIATCASGDVLQFEDEERPSWFTTVGGIENVSTIGFDEFPNPSLTLTDEHTDSGIVFSGQNFVTGPSGSFADAWGLRIFNYNDLYFSEPINWIAADILGSIRIELYNGDQLLFTSKIFGAGPPPHFGGIVSEAAFDHVRIYDPSDDLAVLDNLYFGPPIVVPGPGVGAIVSLGFALCTIGGRRRR